MNIFLADDAALMREGLSRILQYTGDEIIGYACDAPEMLARVRALLDAGEQIDVLVTDVRMPPTMSDDGLRAAVELRRDYPQLSVMILSQYVAPAYAAVLFDAAASSQERGVQTGAYSGAYATFSPHSRASASSQTHSGGVGYLLKDRVARVEDFVRSLSVVASGGMVVDPEVAAGLVKSKSNALSVLTPREKEVIELMAQGLSNSDIAQQLYLSGAAVAKHIANIFLKLGLQPGEENRRVRAVLAYLTATGAV